MLPHLVLACVFVLSTGVARSQDDGTNRGQPTRVLVSLQPKACLATLAAYDVVILDSRCAIDATKAPPSQKVYARVELENPLPGDFQDWAARLVKSPTAPVAARGFNGLALSGLTSVTEDEAAALLDAISKNLPDMPVILCDPPAALDSLRTRVTGFLFEGLFTNREGGPVENPGLAGRIRSLADGKSPVYVVEFAPAATASDAAGKLAARVADLGATPLVTTPSLHGTSLAPLRDHSRRVLIVFGWDPKEEEKPATWPVDTLTADLLQAPLEWLGYEADYLDIGKADLPPDAAAGYAAVIFDGDLNVPLAKEAASARWVLAAKESGLPVLFMGGIPFGSDEARRLLASGLGLKGTLQPVPKITGTTVARADASVVNAEAKVTPRTTEYMDLGAPDKSQVLISLQGRGPDGGLVKFDPVFLASWGGMWLEPYVVFRGSSNSNLFYADPNRILTALLSKRGLIPAPDTTTRDGRRIFYSHIDGDGFASDSSFRGRPLCGELVRDRVLKVFPFPVTVSVIEADMRTLAEGLEDTDRSRIQDIARSIFAMPNVQAASHSFSHPYQWDADDPNPGIYDEPNMPLKPAANYPRIDPAREITGSVDYINKNLLPEGKRVELMLWSGNCRPGVRALQVCRELGIENMNGGNTIVSRLYPGISGTAPRVMQWAGELQIHAANQNEFMYANGWQGPFYGGFADVIDTFERTETGRRTKPVNVYYHFYSATSLSSLRALEKIHRWCQEQPLHSMTALQYAHLAKDAWRTRVYEIGPRHWLLANQGDLRTFRLPSYVGRPDMARSKGISGYAVHQDSLYIHTLGQNVTELVLGDEPDGPVTAEKARIRLASSSAEIEFSELEALKASFSVRDLRPVEVEFAGLQPKAVCEATINSATTRVTADDSGVVKLSLPPAATVTLDATRSRYAIAR